MANGTCTGRTVATKARLPELAERAWSAAQRLVVFGYVDIASDVLISDEASRTIVQGWIDEGRVRVRRGGGTAGRKLFEITPEYRRPRDRASQVAAQLWTAARSLRNFSPVDLHAHCAADLRVQLSEARSYCQALLRAGYLAVVRTGVPGRREAVYRILRNTGPLPPQERRIAAVWDPNEGEFSWLSGVGRIEGIARTRGGR